MSIKIRLIKLEQAAGGAGGCPTCWPWDIDWEVERVQVFEGEPDPEPTRCLSCGRQPRQLFVRRYGVGGDAV